MADKVASIEVPCMSFSLSIDRSAKYRGVPVLDYCIIHNFERFPVQYQLVRMDTNFEGIAARSAEAGMAG